MSELIAVAESPPAAPLYFNEIDPIACAVLSACHHGVVDQRSIKEVTPDDVRGYERCHFFAGAGLWQIAADMAGWRGPLWSASCPCQPFSVAGKGRGRDDERHLWPDFFRLARAVRPPVIVGEQVAGAAGFDWFDGVAADLEGEGYACRAVDIPACAVDAPHRRQRLYWVAVADPVGGSHGKPGHVYDPARTDRCGESGQSRQVGDSSACSIAGGPMADADGWNASAEREQRGGQQRLHTQDRGHPWSARDDQRAEVGMADANSRGRGGWAQDALGSAQRRDAAERADGELGDAHGSRLAVRSIAEVERRNIRDEGAPSCSTDFGSAWRASEWLECADGKARRAPGISEPNLCDVAHGFPAGFEGGDPARLLVPSFKGRAAAWKLAGNAIVPQVAAEVLRALQETLDATV